MANNSSSIFSNITENTTTTLIHRNADEDLRDLIINVILGLVGLACFSFNLLMVLLYIIYDPLKKRISFMMLQVFIFCMLQGLVGGLIYVCHRVYRYTLPDWFCVLGLLLTQFCDAYILLLLPMLVADRYISIKFPMLSKQKIHRWSIITTFVAVGFVFLVVLFPLAPFADAPQRDWIIPEDPVGAAKWLKAYKAYHCNDNINIMNKITPVIMLVLNVFCVVTVVGLYIKMFTIARSRITQFSSMTAIKKQKLKKAAISVMLVAIVFFLTTIPNGIFLQLQALCSYGVFKMDSCQKTTVILYFAMMSLSHSASFFGPLLFTMFNPTLRRAVFRTLSCQRLRSTETSSSSTNSNSAAKANGPPVVPETNFNDY